MKNYSSLWALLFAAMLASCSQAALQTQQTDELKVMTFNIRYDNRGDGQNSWMHRRQRVADAINFYAPDIVGTQEVLHRQLDDLKERLPQYGVVGVGRDDGDQKGEYAALWYRTDRFEALDSGNFWLSATPDRPGSLGWDGACVRIATWARLRDKKSGITLLALNTHLDHVGHVARREGVALILKKVHELSAGAPVVVTGDFNSTPDDEVIALLCGDTAAVRLADSRTAAPLVYGPAWSFHDFGKIPIDERPLLDYVFVSSALRPLKYGVLAETNGDAYLSDHAPVLVTLQLVAGR